MAQTAQFKNELLTQVRSRTSVDFLTSTGLMCLFRHIYENFQTSECK